MSEDRRPPAIHTRIDGDPLDVLGAQIELVAAYAEMWLITAELYRLAEILRETAYQLDEAANVRLGVGRRA